MLLTNWLNKLTSRIHKRPAFRSRDRRALRKRWQTACSNRISTAEVLEDRTLLTAQIDSFLANDVTPANHGDNTYSFDITYIDSNAPVSLIDISTIGVTDVTVTGPGGGGPLTVITAVASSASDGSPITVTYTVTPPGGDWDNTDNGT
ncbi:MAG: hypothetical protein KDA74_18790, partial [Planctomycetaceae bacterium]|nr:hypothetical protein [Planctomycetaceae bacterium]